MSEQANLNLSQFPTGPDLLLRNAFRLAQMPVDSPDRRLKRRQQRLDQAKNMGMDPPSGECPLFPVELSNSQDDIKEALHRISDPINRLFDELFWIWPRKFGGGEEDTGLKLLAENKIEDAIRFWHDDEKQTENFVSTHNLALLHQLLALESDAGAIKSGEPLQSGRRGFLGFGGTKDVAKNHWKNAYSRWALLCKQDSFWHFVEGRIREINDRRLPLESAQWLRQHLPSILLSINIGLALDASEKCLKDHLENQKGIVKDSGFSNDQIDQAYDLETKQYKDKIRSLNKRLEDEIKQNPLGGGSIIRNHIEHVSPLLRLLDDVYASDNRAIDAIHDEVVNTTRGALLTYSNKTEDWKGTLEILDRVQDFVRSSKSSASLKEDRDRVESNRDADSNWCEQGYFELPPECVEVLERARDLEESERFDVAIDVLRDALQGCLDVVPSLEFDAHLYHCIAYCLKRKSVISYNRGFDESERKSRQIIVDSISHDGQINDTYAICCSDGCYISGEYVVRSVPGVDHRFPFCKSCNQKLEVKLEELEKELNHVRQDALNLIVLANHLNPTNKSISENLNVIRQTTSEKGIQHSDIKNLVDEWNIYTASDLVERLANSQGERAQTYKKLTGIIDRQVESIQEQTLVKLFEALLSTADLKNFLSILYSNKFIFTRFIKYAFFEGGISAAGQNNLIETVCHQDDYLIKFAIIDIIERFTDVPSNLVSEITKSLQRNIESMAQAGIDSLETGICGELLSKARQYDELLEKRLFKQILSSSSNLVSGEILTLLYRAVLQSSRYLGSFFNAVFFDKKGKEIFQGLHLGLKHISDVGILFAVLMELKEREFDDVAIRKIESWVKEKVIDLAQRELSENAYSWMSGELSAAMQISLTYKPDFEGQLFNGILSSVSKRGKFAENMITAISLVPADRSRLMKYLVAGTPNSSDIARDVFFQLLVFHWDPELRLVALRRFLENCANDEHRHVALIRFLADESSVVRRFAEEELVKTISKSLGLCLEAMASENLEQRKFLIKMLSSQDLSVQFDCQPSFTALVTRIHEYEDARQLKVLVRYLNHFYPTPSVRDLDIKDIGILKYTKAHGNTTQREIAIQLLNKIRKLSVLWRYRVWNAPVLKLQKAEAWWNLAVAGEPDISDVPETSRDRRKMILKLVRASLQEWILCPVCNHMVKTKNLVAHFDKVHREEFETSSAGDSPLITVSYPVAMPGDRVPRNEPELLDKDESSTPKRLRFRFAGLFLIVVAGWAVSVSEHPFAIEVKNSTEVLVGELISKLDVQKGSNRRQRKNLPPVTKAEEPTTKIAETSVKKIVPIEEAAPKPVQIGSAEVRNAQKILTMLGYEPGPVDGIWGGKTKRAMQAFQKKSGLSTTERLNLKTYSFLQATESKLVLEEKKGQAENRSKVEERRIVEESRKANEAKHAEEQKRREAELMKSLEAEETQHSPDALKREYVVAIREKVERNWIKPAGQQKLPVCEVRVLQGPGGIILDVSFGACGGGTASYRASIKNAIYRAEPLPKPKDPGIFERELILLFNPRDK